MVNDECDLSTSLPGGEAGGLAGSTCPGGCSRGPARGLQRFLRGQGGAISLDIQRSTCKLNGWTTR